VKFLSSLLNSWAFTLGIEPKLHKHFHFLTMFVLVLLSMHLYNFQRSLTYGYQISELSSVRTRINSVQQKNNIELSKLQSLDYIKTTNLIDSMVTPRNTNFVNTFSKTALNYTNELNR